MKTEHSELQERLQGFSIDADDASFPFSSRLAKENEWTPVYTRRVIEEYKRFAFLSVVAGHPVSPSESVDQAWHLHLTYTQNYWKEFCANILRKPLHHHPTQGGAAERDKFDDWYRKTLESYRQFFGEGPPADIWPDPDAKLAKSHHFVRVDRQQNWVIPKPQFGPRSRRMVLMLVLVLMVSGSVAASGGLNPFELRGPDFLLFYLLAATVGFGIAAWLRWLLRKPDENERKDVAEPDPYSMACLKGGKILVVNTAIANLMNQKLLKLDAKNHWLTAVGIIPKESHVMERTVFAAACRVGGEKIRNVRFATKPRVQKILDELKETGLVVNNRHAVAAIIVPLLVGAIVPVMGIIKIFIGVSRDRPVGFLFALTAVSALVLGFGFARRPRRSRLGDAVLQQLKQRHASLEKVRRPSALTPLELATAVGLFGLESLRGSELDSLRRDLRPPSAAGADGGSGCGGSGCGGGGCGGGCGGCGGGD